MRRKRKKVVVTVTETWTFVFDEADEMSAPPPATSVTASISTPSQDAALPMADASDAPSAEV